MDPLYLKSFWSQRPRGLWSHSVFCGPRCPPTTASPRTPGLGDALGSSAGAGAGAGPPPHVDPSSVQTLVFWFWSRLCGLGCYLGPRTTTAGSITALPPGEPRPPIRAPRTPLCPSQERHRGTSTRLLLTPPWHLPWVAVPLWGARRCLRLSKHSVGTPAPHFPPAMRAPAASGEPGSSQALPVAAHASSVSGLS